MHAMPWESIHVNRFFVLVNAVSGDAFYELVSIVDPEQRSAYTRLRFTRNVFWNPFDSTFDPVDDTANHY